MAENYQIEVKQRGRLKRTEIWSWYGEKDNEGNKVLFNHFLYASDTKLILDETGKVVGGYSYVFNGSNELIVEKIK